MTQQLKFGDIVLLKETGQKGSVIDFKFGVVVALHGDTHIDTFDYDEIELIPHPDTSRLDWLFEKDHHLRSRWCTDEHDNLRDAIDAAIKETN